MNVYVISCILEVFLNFYQALLAWENDGYPYVIHKAAHTCHLFAHAATHPWLPAKQTLLSQTTTYPVVEKVLTFYS